MFYSNKLVPDIHKLLSYVRNHNVMYNIRYTSQFSNVLLQVASRVNVGQGNVLFEYTGS